MMVTYNNKRISLTERLGLVPSTGIISPTLAGLSPPASASRCWCLGAHLWAPLECFRHDRRSLDVPLVPSVHYCLQNHQARLEPMQAQAEVFVLLL